MDKISCRFKCPKEDEDVVDDEAIFRHWSKAEEWTSGKIPVANDNVIIEAGWQMKFDIAESPILNLLEIKGKLLFENLLDVHTLKAKRILIRSTGSLMIGSETEQFTKKANIILHGEKEDP